ncbi:MAG: squalene synthase HpnC [Acidobacteriota bacterium]
MVVDDAYETCLRLARQHYENFPVASRLLPKASRPHIAAIYAFARIADDFADEGDLPQAERLARLEEWQWRLHEAAEGRVQPGDSDASRVFTALMHTMRQCQLDVQPFDDLLSAFGQDVVVTRYETWAELLDYCRRSANPVGRLVLRICGYRDAGLDRQSDAICTALQLTNFWQDLAVDWAKGRLYVPRDVREQADAEESALGQREWPSSWESAMRDAVTRTRERFAEGRPLLERVHGRLRHELRATWVGGMRVLDKLESRHYNVFEHRPRLGWQDAVVVGWRVLRWRS